MIKRDPGKQRFPTLTVTNVNFASVTKISDLDSTKNSIPATEAGLCLHIKNGRIQSANNHLFTKVSCYFTKKYEANCVRYPNPLMVKDTDVVYIALSKTTSLYTYVANK